MKYIIDRFEGTYAILEDGKKNMIEVIKEGLPIGIKEGDIVELKNGKFQVERSETQKRRERIEELAKDLWE